MEKTYGQYPFRFCGERVLPLNNCALIISNVCHMHIIGKGKASAADLPEDQSLENILSDAEIAFRPARNPAGKLLDQAELQELLEKVKSTGQTTVLAELLAI